MSLFNFLSNSFNRFFVKKFTKTANQSSALPPLKAFILEPILTPSGVFSSGTFTADHTGLVSIDYLFDGGSYQGELAIFSLSGMEGLTPGSHEFIQEAAHRALTDSILGHIVIADSVDGARFDVSSGENWNAGEYLGIKSFAMNPDSEFGIMLVPNGHIQQVFDNPALEGDLRPLFSMVTANPNDGFHVGQIADVTGNGSTFVMEDLRMDLGTDRDYNDMIFQVRGAIGKAALMKDEIQPYGPDWRLTDTGKALLDYIQPYENSLLHPTSPLVSPPPDSHQPLVGIIDSYGFSHNNPDLNYQHIIAGKDLVDHDPNPYVPVDQPDPGTHLAGIIQATQNNQIGINGINDNAPMWFGRASNSNWADSLTEFVNVTKDSHQTAVIQLNLDLTHINIDGTVTTRYELTPVELHALDYARQNHVIVVVPAGDDGSVVSGLGQASQQFDNVVTVGSAHRITDDPHVPIAEAYARTDYSNYGASLDIVADGGTIKDPITSTVGDSIGTMAGTAVAAAQVVGALSLLWANNPNLDYRQVIEILKNTATDLNTPGWDNQTGVGLLNPKAAVGFAPITPIEWYVDPPINTPIAPPGYRVYIVQPEDSLIGIGKNELHSDDGWKEIIKTDGSNFSNKTDGLTVGDVIYLPIKHEVGSGTPLVTRPSPIPTMPPQLELHGSQSFYIEGEPVRLVGSGLAYDFNGASDVSKVELWLQLPDGTKQNLTNFTGANLKIDADGFISFDYDLSPTNLGKGVYQLNAIAYDQAGLASNLISDSFAVISPSKFNPGNSSGSNAVTYAIERATDLTNYTSGQIADTHFWTVGLPPNFPSERIKALADSVGATYLKDKSSPIPDTAVWEFPPNLTPAEIAVILEKITDVKFFYPIITYRLEFPQLIMNSPLFPDQWNLHNTGQTGGTPGADANVLPVWADYGITGRGVTIGIVDDGVQYIHPNLISNYLADLSYDFTQDWQYYPDNQSNNYNDYALVDPEFPTEYSSGVKRLAITPPPDVFLRRAIVAPGKKVVVVPPRSIVIRRAIVAPGKKIVIVPPKSVVIKRVDDSQLDPSDVFFYAPSMHGSAAAGIAVASNNGGVVGVAPNASFANLKLIQDSVVDNQIAEALYYDPDNIARNIDIYNNSWKPEVPFAILPSALLELETGATSGRGGLGNIYVFAAGNDALDGDNINYNGLANSRHAIAVAAIDDKGKSAWYSTPGAAILVAAYSSSNDPDGRSVGITTTDLIGNNGFDPSSYTHDFGGTSAAAPLVSGVIALMLEANPNLTQRDVQHILIEAARHNDPSDPEWVTNGAGYDVNYKYGFGAVDAKAAVAAALNWKPISDEVDLAEDYPNEFPEIFVNASIPDYDPALVVDPDHPENAPNNPSSLASTITVTKDIDVEWAEVMFDATHTSRGDLKVTLTSPDGTESILAEPRYDAEDDYSTWVFTTNRNWGESSLGDWTLRVSDEIDGEVGTFNSWKLNLYGTAKSNVTITAGDPSANENGNAAQFIVTRSGGDLNKPLTVNYSVAGNAINGSDYSTLPGTITIPAGATSVTIPVIPKSDGEVEGDETVQINLIDAAGYNLDPVTTRATATITDSIPDGQENHIPSNSWTNQLGSTNYDQFNAVAVDAQGNTYAAGFTRGSLDGNTNGSGVGADWPDPILTKYDTQGNKLWTRQTGTTAFDYNTGVTVDSNGNAYTIGYGTVGDSVITKWDSNGNQIWSRSFHISPQDWASGISTDSQGNVFVVGQSDYSILDPSFDTQAFATKYDSNGNQIWTKQFGTANQDTARSVVTDQDGNIYIAGVTAGSLDGNVNAGGTDVFVTKYDNNGNLIWTRQLGSNAAEGYIPKAGNGEYARSVSIAIDSNNGIYITGTTEGSLDGNVNAGGQDTFTAKYDSDGNKLWTRQLGSTGDERSWGVGTDSKGNVYITGQTSSALDGNANQGISDGFIVKYDSNGNKLETKLFGTNATDGAIDVAVDSSGNVYLAGVTAGSLGGTNVGNADSWISKNEFIQIPSTPQSTTGHSEYGPFVYTNPANGHRYLLTQPDTWLGAQAQAQALGGDLVTINDLAEQTWLSGVFNDQAAYWKSNNTSGGSSTAQYGIIEIDPATLAKPIVLIQTSDAKAGEEGNAGQLIVTRIGDTTNPLTVNYSVAGDAINGVDYQALNGTITIPAGASLVTIPIVPIGDYQSENAEKVVVNLTANSSYQVSAQGTGTVEIANESPINFLYRQVLGRDADSNGLNYHTQLLQNGKSIEQIRWQMAHDTLFGEAKDQITLMYQTLVGRAPLATEISYWQDRLGVDTTLSQVREFLSSTVADSIGEFSLTQGQNNWYYGYYDGSLNSNDFKLLSGADSNPQTNYITTQSGLWTVDSTDYWNSNYWTYLAADGGHPNGGNPNGRTAGEQLPVRRWVSNVDGEIYISGELAKQAFATSGGDGVTGRIFVDGVEVWSQAIAANDSVGNGYSISAAVHQGSVVDFVIDPNSSDASDHTQFTATITTEPLTPQPTTSRIYTNPITGNQYFLTASDTWLGAEEQAKAAGGNLVAINDADENAWLLKTFGNDGLWIGLTDSEIYGAKEGQYKWVNGQPVTYTNWYPGMPNNVLHTPEGEDFILSFGTGREWDDYLSDSSVLNPTWHSYGIVEIASPPTAQNLTMAQIYTEDTPLDLTNIVVTSPDGQATVTLTVPVGAGSLTTGTSGSVTSTYDAVTGKWTASGYVPDVNALLAGLQFIPAANYNSTFNITTEVATSAAAPLTGYLHLIGIPVNDAPTLSSVSMLTGAKDNTPFTITYDTLAAAANEADIDSSIIAFQIDSLLTGTLTKNGVAIVPGVTTVAPGESLVWTPAIAGENLAFTVRANDFQAVSSISIPVKIDVIPTVTITASDANATEGADSGAFTITRTGKTDKPLTVNYSVANDPYRPAINGSDYNYLPGTITIPAGQSAITIPLTPIDDNAAEWEEPAYMNLSADSGYLLGASTGAQVTIWDNETPEIYIGTYNPSYTFGWDGYTSESSNTTSLLVRRLGSLANDVTVNYTLTGTATNGLDYSTLPGSILLAAGQHDTYIPFTAINDTLVESDETAILTLLPGANNTVGGEVTNPTVGTSFMPTLGMASMTIGDNDSKLTANIVATDAIGSEYGDRAEFTISLTDANGNPATATVPLTLNYSIWGADNGGDYTNLPGTITIPVGSSSAKLVVNPINDGLVEGSEGVGVLLYANFGDNYAVGANEVATLSITDNDYAASYVEDTTLDLPNAIITDPDGNTSVTLTLSNITAGRLTTGTSGAVTSSFNAATGKWTASGALADVNALLANLKFVPNANYNSDLSISIAITDNPLTTLPGTIKLTGIPVDDAPTATNLNSTQTYTEGVTLDLTNIVVSDIDSSTLTATLVLSNPAGGVLTTGTSGSTTSTYNAATGVWQVSGAKADVNALLASVKFTPATNFNSNLTIATQVSDGVTSLAGAITLNGTPVNYAPTFAYTASQTYTEDTALYLTGLAVSDADPEDTITATLKLSNVSAGSLSTLTSGSATATFNATTGIWTVSGNAADVNVILANLYFIPASNFNSNLTISASVTDSHSTPINRIINLIGTAVNDAPTLSSISVLTGATEKVAYTIPYTNLKAASDVQDVDGNAIKFLITAVNSGTLTKNGTAVVPGVTTLSTGESLVWTPANFGNAIPAFNVVATDGTANSATAVPVTVNVAANLNIQKVSIAAIDASASESGDTGTVTISRTGITTNALTVNYSTSGTATNGSDYNNLSGSITIPAGSSSVNIPITAINDTEFEGDEYLNLNLQTSANYVLEGSTSATVSIADNDKPTVSIVASDANAAETLSTETANTGEFIITRTGTTANSLTLNYTVAGTATNGSDYNSLGSTIVIPAGASSVTIPIVPIDNFTLESTETVVLNLSTDTTYNLGTNNSATVNITDNDTSIYESNQTLATAYDLGIIGFQTINDSVSSLDTTDYYKFDVASTGTVTLNIQNFSAGTTLKGELVTKNGPTSSTSLFTVNSSGTVNISSSAYAGGTNYIRIYQGSGDASYSFEISKTA